MRYYAGIGSRQTPKDILFNMSCLADILESSGYILRSGGADGADSAFSLGVKNPSNKIVYLPWYGFNGVFDGVVLDTTAVDVFKIASQYHPSWRTLSEGVKKLHARNVYQVLGLDLKTPSDFIVCWTKDGGASGGTGQAIRIATAYKIPVFNLFWKNSVDKLSDFLHKGGL